MEMMELKCREHNGGIFRKPRARGRPPVRCSEDNRCSAVRPTRKGTAQRVAKAVPVKVVPATKATNGKAQRDAAAVRAAVTRAVKTAVPGVRVEEGVPATLVRKPRAKAPVSEPETMGTTNPSLPMAQAAKAQLEPLGWTVNGRAWLDEDGKSCASILGNRGVETISVVWCDGSLVNQEYVLWGRVADTKLNFKGMPPRKLNFDPDEASDRELVERLSGMKVTWWNRLAKDTESAIIPDKVAIEHVYNGVGDETPGERIIKFCDKNGSGYRAFYVAALVKVG